METGMYICPKCQGNVSERAQFATRGGFEAHMALAHDVPRGSMDTYAARNYSRAIRNAFEPRLREENQ